MFLINGLVVGWVFSLTTATDTYSGTSGDDTVTGVMTGGSDKTINISDVVDGSTGTNTLNLKVTGAGVATNTAPTFNNFQVVKVQALDGATARDFDATLAPQMTQFVNNGSQGKLTVSNMASVATTLAMNNVTLATNGDMTVTYTNAATTAASDTVKISLNGNGAASQTSATAPDLVLNLTAAKAGAEGVENLEITTTGAASVLGRLGSDAISSGTTSVLRSVTVLGDKALTVKGNIDFAGTLDGTFDASKATANVDVAFDSTDNNAITVTGGSGNDRFNFNGGLATSDKIDGGTGTNTLAASTGAAFTTGLQVSNINTIEVTGALTTGDLTLALGNVSGAKDAYLSAVAGGVDNAVSATVSGLQNGSTVTVETDNDADATQLTLSGTSAVTATASTSDVLNFKTNANDTAGAAAFGTLVTTGFETVSITSTRAASQADVAGALTITAWTDAQLQTVNLTGDTSVSIVANTGQANLSLIDGSKFTGNIVLGNSTTSALVHATDGATFKTGSGNDTITFDATLDSALSLDAGSQTSTGADTLILMGTAGTGSTKIDLSSTTDQITQVNGSANNSAKQIGFENVTSALATNGIDIVGSSGKNTITGSNAVGDTIRGGAGADTINVGTTGSDVLKYDSADVASGTALSNADVISNFAIAADVIDTASFVFKAVAGTASTSAFSTDDFTVAAVALGSAGGSDTTNLYTLTSANNSVGASQSEIDATVAEIVAAASTSVFTATAATKAFISVVGADSNDVALFYYSEAGTNGIQASELSLVGVFTSASQFTAAVLQ